MTSQTSAGAAAEASKYTSAVSFEGSQGAVNKYDGLLPKSVDYEDSLSDAQSAVIWEKLYKAAGLGRAGEQERTSLRIAVYVYLLINGTSREGDYAGQMVLANGKTIQAADIPRCAGVMNIRKWARANMAESYHVFKTTDVMSHYPRFLAKMNALGISDDLAFATADWFANNPAFTPGETRAYQTALVHNLDRAKRARGGHSLEDVEKVRIKEIVDVNGPAEPGQKVDF